jgi:Mg-chelatase subunit ChlD
MQDLSNDVEKQANREDRADTSRAYEDEKDVVKNPGGITQDDIQKITRQGEKNMDQGEIDTFIKHTQEEQTKFEDLKNSGQVTGELDPTELAKLMGTKRAKLQGNVLAIFQRLLEQAITIEEEIDQTAPSRKVKGLTGAIREVSKVGRLSFLLDASGSMKIDYFKQALKAIDFYMKQYFTGIEGAYVTVWGANAVTKKTTNIRYANIAKIYTKAQKSTSGITGSTLLLGGWKSLLTTSSKALECDVAFVFSDFELFDTDVAMLKKICRRFGKRVIYIATKHENPKCPLMDKADPSWRKRLVYLAPLAQQAEQAGI